MGNVVKLFFPQKTYDRLRDILVGSKKSVEDLIFEEIQNLCVKGRQVIDTETFPTQIIKNGIITPQQAILPDLKEYQLDFNVKWKPKNIENIKYVTVEINAGENVTSYLKAFCAAINYLNNAKAHLMKEAKQSRIKQCKKENKTLEQTENMKKGFDELIKSKTTIFESVDIILQDSILPEINKKLDDSIRLTIQKEHNEIKNK